MPELLSNKSASRLCIYLGESDHWRGKPLYTAILEELRKNQIAGATVIRGAAGFGVHSHLHTSAIEVLSLDLPIIIESIDTPEKISAVIEKIFPMVNEGLITLEDVKIIKHTHRYLNPLPSDLLVSEIMTRDVIHFSPETSLWQAWNQMLKRSVKCAPVVNENHEVIGFLTDRDLLEKGGIQERLSIAIRLSPEKISQEMNDLQNSPLKVSELMSHPVITVTTSDSLGTATALMVKHSLKRLPVVDAENKLVGILSRLDILQQVAKTHKTASPAHIPGGAVKTIQDVMNKNFPVIGQDDDLSRIVEKFTQTDTHKLIVIDENGIAVGLISDSDVVARIQPEKQSGIMAALRRLGKPPLGQEIAFDLMSPGVLSAPPDTSVAEAVKLMLEQSRKWLVVVDERNQPLGLVDRRILLESIATVYPTTSSPSMKPQ